MGCTSQTIAPQRALWGCVGRFTPRSNLTEAKTTFHQLLVKLENTTCQLLGAMEMQLATWIMNVFHRKIGGAKPQWIRLREQSPEFVVPF
jgi:hypothetical protein